jgi:dCMP deaminase
MIKEKYLGAYMKTAKIFAGLSSAKRRHVGAIIVKDDRIISIGYNGMPSGWDNNCEDIISSVWEEPDLHNLKTKPEVLHAESNAIAKLAKSTESGDGASMFITCSPCIECAKMIYQSGIKEVYYGEEYKSCAGLEFLNKCGVKLMKLDDNDLMSKLSISEKVSVMTDKRTKR